jgi:hypothetical protein
MVRSAAFGGGFRIRKWCFGRAVVVDVFQLTCPALRCGSRAGLAWRLAFLLRRTYLPRPYPPYRTSPTIV